MVVLNVHNGNHYVLATGYSGSTIFVNDPGHSTTGSYDLSEIVDGQNVVYVVTARQENTTAAAEQHLTVEEAE